MSRTPLILIILAYGLLTGFKSDGGRPERGVLTGGFIDITVESNINRVFFSYPLTGIGLYNETDPENVKITVPVKDFRCANEIAYNDFVSLLKADQYPDISISIPQDVLIRYTKDDHVTIHDLIIRIAGVSRRYDITCRIENPDSEGFFLLGTLKIRLSDLNIDPPVKYFGLVKVKDEVIVKFGFSFNDYRLAISKKQG